MIYPSSSLPSATKSPWKRQNHLTNSCFCNHYEKRKITHLTIFSPSTLKNTSPTCLVVFNKKNESNKNKKGTKFSNWIIQKGIIGPVKSRKIRSIVLLNLTAFVYASDIPVLKEVEAFMDPAAFCAVRFAMSAIPFLPFVIRARNDVNTRNSGMELGFWVSLGYLVEALGLLTSEAGRASIISLFTVIVVPILESMLGSIVPTRTWFGILMSVLGIAMLECSGSPPNVGDLLNFLSAIFFGIHMLRTEHISRTTKKENLLALLGYEILVVAVLSIIWFLVGGLCDSSQDYDMSLAILWDWMLVFPWIPALYTGLFSTGLCMWAEMDAMRDVSATESAMIYGMEPVWGAAFAWFLLGERWGVAGWIGAALILGGSLTVQIFGSSAQTSADNKEFSDKKTDVLMGLKDQKLQKKLTASPVVITSRKDVRDVL